MAQAATLIENLNNVYGQILQNKDETLDPYIKKVTQKEDLTPAEAVAAMKILVSDGVSKDQQRDFLTALHIKKATVDEIAAFAFTLRKSAVPFDVKIGGLFHRAALGDTCGTGGGTFGTFNVSTTIMFILASAGIYIAKHGNRAITSQCGSADVLEELGVNINLEPNKVAECISKIKIGFIFAPNFHKTFKNVQKVRQELPFPTIFNILGPLANPAFNLVDTKARYSQVLGVNDPELTEDIARVLQQLNVQRAIVVYGYNGEHAKGMDELSTVGKTKVSELKGDGSIENYFLEPEQFGFKQASSKDLKGGSPKENAEILRNILKGVDKGPKRDLVLLNAAAGLYVGGEASTIKEGIKLAEQKIDSGEAYAKLESLIKFSTGK